MPYFLFAVKGFGQLEKLGEFTAFREASVQAKALRAEPGAPVIKVIFGADQITAEDTLLQIRAPQPQGDD
jgi:hypothetical protein